MNRPLPPLKILAASTLGMMICAYVMPVSASDAYDDEPQQQRPESDSKESNEKQEGGTLDAGGLQPPDSIADHEHGRSEIEQELEESDRKDAGRGLEFVWLSGDVGYGAFGLSTLSSKGLLSDDEQSSGHGLLAGAGAGVRLLYFTAGARLRYGLLSSFDLFSLMAEVGVRFPLGAWEPFASLAAGYTAAYDLQLERPSPETTRISGANIRLAGGVGYYFSDSFSMATQLAAETLVLHRRAQQTDDACTAEQGCVYAKKGSSLGGGLSLTLSLGLHF